MLGLVPLPDWGRRCVERILLRDVPQIGQLFLCHFLPKVLEVLSFCVLEVVMPLVFSCVYWFPDGVIVSFKLKQVSGLKLLK